VIHPIRFSDIFLIQRLLRYSTRLDPARSLLQPRSPVWQAFIPANPLDDARVYTYVLNQRDNTIARAGVLQAQKRPGRPEIDIVLLTPRLDTKFGHPAIWQKLLSHFAQEVISQHICRIYAVAPDEPTVVQTLASVGFRTYSHQTIWRLTGDQVDARRLAISDAVRLQRSSDEWGLLRLYSQSTPRPVQVAEGMRSQRPLKPPILAWRHTGENYSFVLSDAGRIRGCVKVAVGRQGVWLRLWFDPQLPTSQRIESLVRQGIVIAAQRAYRLPVYVGVDEYQGGLASTLVDLGFAPFIDVVKTVRHTVQHVVERSPLRIPIFEPATTIVPVPYHRRTIGTPGSTTALYRTKA
jgi:hypothetical protein